MNRICPKCQTVMTLARPHIPMQPSGKLTAFKEPVSALGRNVGSTLSVFICSGCGFAEWYADQPEHFAPEGT